MSSRASLTSLEGLGGRQPPMARDLRAAHRHQVRKVRLGLAHFGAQASGYPRLVISFAPARRYFVLEWQAQARALGHDLQPETPPLRAFSFCDAFSPPNPRTATCTYPDRRTYRLYAANFSLTTLPSSSG